MTADRLARRYSFLKPDDRLALKLAAQARGDDVEHERLVAAAPRLSLAVADTFPRYMAFREVLDRHRAERLELAARFFRTRRLAEGYAEGPGGRMAVVARAYGYLLLAARDGWDRFCREHLLRSGGLEAALVGGEVLRASEAEAAGDGVTEEVAALIGAKAGPGAAVKPAASVAGMLAAVFAARLAAWEGGRLGGPARAGGRSAGSFRRSADRRPPDHRRLSGPPYRTTIWTSLDRPGRIGG